MTNPEDTVEIPSVPQPTSILWLGILAATGVVSWLVTVVTMLLNDPPAGQLVAAGLCVSVTVSIGAGTAWARYSLAKVACENWRQATNLLTGQHAHAVAELRNLRWTIEQAAGRASAERQSIGVKLTKIVEEMPTYWHGIADEALREAEGNVRTFPHRGR